MEVAMVRGSRAVLKDAKITKGENRELGALIESANIRVYSRIGTIKHHSQFCDLLVKHPNVYMPYLSQRFRSVQICGIAKGRGSWINGRKLLNYPLRFIKGAAI